MHVTDGFAWRDANKKSADHGVRDRWVLQLLPVFVNRGLLSIRAESWWRGTESASYTSDPAKHQVPREQEISMAISHDRKASGKFKQVPFEQSPNYFILRANIVRGSAWPMIFCRITDEGHSNGIGSPWWSCSCISLKPWSTSQARSWQPVVPMFCINFRVPIQISPILRPDESFVLILAMPTYGHLHSYSMLTYIITKMGNRLIW